jgi:hypothetical protein
MNWRDVIVRLPLPMLALAASWGVYSFQILFVPFFFALISALSFELVYIGLSLVVTPDRRKAAMIASGAVAVSIIYNTLAGMFHRNPDWLIDLPWQAEIGLSLLHGAPLALLAYMVADLLHHTQQQQQKVPEGSLSIPGYLLQAPVTTPDAPQLELVQVAEDDEPDIVELYEQYGSIRQVGKVIGVSHTTVRKRLLELGVTLERAS